MIEHSEAINIICNLSNEDDRIISVIVFGSLGRENLSPGSDIDLFILLKDGEDSRGIKDTFSSFFKGKIKFLLEPEEDKIILYYTENLLKADIIISSDRQLLKKYFLGSEIKKPSSCILIDKTGMMECDLEYYIDSEIIFPAEIVDKLTSQFIESFEHASYVLAKNDYYRFYFQYNIALAKYVSLFQINLNDFSHLYLPKNIVQRMDESKREVFEKLCSSSGQNGSSENLIVLKREFCNCYAEISRKYCDLNYDAQTISDFLDGVMSRDEDCISGIR